VALIVAFVAALSSGETPLNVLQLLWVNLIMDSLAALGACRAAAPQPLWGCLCGAAGVGLLVFGVGAVGAFSHAGQAWQVVVHGRATARAEDSL
jgi:hypothetical protein